MMSLSEPLSQLSVRASSQESKRTPELREDCPEQVETSEWHIGHEEDAQGSDDANKTPRDPT